MTRYASAALMPLADAVGRLVSGVVPVAERMLPVSAAIGFAAAHDVFAERDSPERPTALRDGWAVEADSVTGASAYAPILLTAPPIWVEAGEILPDCADTVLPPEALEGRTFVADAPAGDGVRRQGEDLAAGVGVLAAGTRIRPQHLFALAAAGLAEIPVRRPRVALVATGDSAPLAVALAARIVGDGGDPAMPVTVPDDPAAIAAAIRAAPADAVLVLGGTGPGRTDHSVAALALAGEVLAHGIAIRPGETAAIGRADGRSILLLPGRPDAALAVYLALGRPLLAVLSGGDGPEPVSGILTRKVSATIGVSDVVFVRRHAGGVEPLGGADLALSRLAEADAAILVPPELEGYPQGTTVEVLTL